MKKYIALLRGVNVGGNNKINMNELKLLFETLGFTDVTTYINSGNVIFSSERTEKETKTSCEQGIKDKFKLDISVFIISDKNLSEALQNAPSWWNKDKESKHNAIFVIMPATAEEMKTEIGNIKPEYEQICYHKNVIFWSAPIKTFHKTRLTKIVHTSLKNKVTIRNANTTIKVLEIAEK